MSHRLAMHVVLLTLTGLIGWAGLDSTDRCHAQELQWRDLEEIADVAKSQPRPVLWFRVLGDMKGYM